MPALQVAALKLEMCQQEAEHEEREVALLRELAALRSKLAAKKQSPTKMLKKTLSQVRCAAPRCAAPHVRTCLCAFVHVCLGLRCALVILCSKCARVREGLELLPGY